MTRHILICDDEVGVRESLKAYLDDKYRLSFAKTANEALTCLKSSDFDLLIIDIKMPGINGLDAVRKIKALKPSQKIAMLSGYESVSLVDEASKLGINSYVAKPVGKEKLLKAVQEALK